MKPLPDNAAPEELASGRAASGDESCPPVIDEEIDLTLLESSLAKSPWERMLAKERLARIKSEKLKNG